VENGQSQEKAEQPASQSKKKVVQGVFIAQGERALFRPVQTGIVGETDIEIVSGLDEGAEVIVGPYRELRTLKHNMLIKKEYISGRQ